jgi:hypothetical protein
MEILIEKVAHSECYTTELMELQAAQRAIIWDALLFGNITIQWREVQEWFYRESGTRCESLHWDGMLVGNPLWELVGISGETGVRS